MNDDDEGAARRAREVTELTSLAAELDLAKAQLMQSRGEQERLTRLLLKDFNSGKQKSAFSIDDVPELVAFLKKQ